MLLSQHGFFAKSLSRLLKDPTHPMKARLALFIVISIAALTFSLSYPDTESALIAYFNLGYANIAVLTALAAYALTKGESQSFKTWICQRETHILILGCLVATIYLFTREGGGFKIAFDEQVLTTVSKSLHQTHIPAVSESPLFGYSRFERLGKRPILFPFLLSLVHDGFGYRSSNGFYLNGVLTFCFLLLLSGIIRRIAAARHAYISIVLCCFTPLIAQNASGAGFEMLNLCCLFLVAWFAMDFWSRPTADTFGKLAFAGALASQVRYESVLVILPIAALALTVWLREKRISLPWIACSIPLFFIPLVWQQRVVSASPEAFQYAVENSSPFSLDHLSKNLEAAFQFLFIPSNLYPGSPFIGFIGICATLVLLAVSFTRKKALYTNQPDRVALLFMLLYLFPLLGVHAVFFYGQYNDPIVSRLSLPLLVFFIVVGSLMAGGLYKKRKATRYLCIAFLVTTGLYSSKQYGNPGYHDPNSLQERAEWAIEFANQLPSGEYLFVSTMPLVFEVENLNSIHSARIRMDLARLQKQLEFKTYRDIFVVENFRLDRSEGKLVASHLPQNHLGAAVKLEPLAEASFAVYNFSRISRVTKIDLTQAGSLNEIKPDETDPSNSTQFKTPSPEDVLYWHEWLY